MATARRCHTSHKWVSFEREVVALRFAIVEPGVESRLEGPKAVLG
jgi:hypothetical protein